MDQSQPRDLPAPRRHIPPELDGVGLVELERIVRLPPMIDTDHPEPRKRVTERRTTETAEQVEHYRLRHTE